MTDPLDGRAIFVSPHLDDVALSCGGTVALHSSRGQRPLIVTVAAGVPGGTDGAAPVTEFQFQDPDHGDNESARYVASRRREDAAAAAVLGASTRWFPYLDAVYRGYGAAIFGKRRQEQELADRIADDLEQVWRETGSGSVLLPLALGNHVDHQLCASLHDRLRRAGVPVWHYEDVPYVLRWAAAENWMNAMEPASLRGAIKPYLEQRLAMMGLVPCLIDVTRHMPSRLAAVECYKSQIAGLFPQHNHRALISAYAARLMPTPEGAYAERFWAMA
jgi:LmbE family N-acetylglucosaminyl deacetylase